MSIFRRLFAAEGGTIMVLAAFALTAVMGMSGLAVEVGNGYSTKVRNQRVADMAALGAAQAYQANQSVAVATQVAKDIVAASGLPASSATVNAPVTINGSSAITVTVTTAVPVRLAQVVMNNTSYNVTNTAAASLTGSPGCFTTLSSTATNGISLTGGTSMTATGCGVGSNAGISLTWGTKITAQQVVAGKAVSDPGSGITTTPTASNVKQNKGTSYTDTVGSDPRIVAGFAKVGTYTAVSTPNGNPADWNFDWNHSGAVASWWNSSTGTYTVPANTVPYKVGSITVAGGIKVVVQDGVAIQSKGGIAMSGTSMTMGAVTLDIGGQVNVSGGGSMSVASGNVAIGGSSGNAINVDGGASLSFGNGTFSANGSITTAGGSSITFGATASHYINGALSLSGNATFGAGAYYVNGSFSNGTGGAMIGTGVTFFLGGTLSAGGGASMNLIAPTSDSGGGVTNLLFATKSNTATTLSGGASGILGGMIYAPNSDLNMSGGASANSGGCFSMVVNTITLSGGTAAGTACNGLGSGSSGGGGVSLLQ